MTREATILRETAETRIEVTVNLDGAGQAEIATGIGFFDHMLCAFARHGRFDLKVSVRGDLHVDGHHTVEDTGIVLGRALAEALGEKAGIERFGSAFVPMDEALVLAALDISGRGQLHWDVEAPFGMVGDFDTQLAREFFIALAANAGITLHIRQLAGDNVHHIFEAAFKAAGRALRQAVAVDPALGGAVHIHEGEKCGDGLEGAIGKGQCGGIHHQLDRPLRGLVQFLRSIVDGGDLPAVDQADHAFSAAAQVQNGAGQVFWEGQLHLYIPFDISIH